MARKSIDARLDGIEQLLKEYTAASQARLDALDGRVAALEERSVRTAHETRTIKDDLDRALALLDKLISDGSAVLRRDDGRCALDKDLVYEAAEQAHIGRRTLLKLLDEAGVLLKETDGPPKRYTRKTRINGQAVRAVIIINQNK